MAQNTTTTSGEDYISQMYNSNLAAQQAQLAAQQAQANADLDAQKEATAKAADEALAKTYVEAQKQQKNYAEVQNAYGLTSGAMAQAKLAQNNQLQSDMTTIRAAQQEADAQIERQRGLLAQQYAAAISQAQAENDLARAQALYAAAQNADAKLLQQQKEAAALMAQVGDFSLYQTLYGLTDAQLAALTAGYWGSILENGDEEDDEEEGDSAAISNEDLAELQRIYPFGVVKDKNEWDRLVATYGEKALKNAGYSLLTVKNPREGFMQRADTLIRRSGAGAPMVSFGNEIAANAAVRPLENNPLIGYEDPFWSEVDPITGIKPSTLDDLGYAGYPEDAIALLVDAGMLQENIVNGVLYWSLGPNNVTETGEAKYTSKEALTMATLWDKGGRK